MNTCYIVSTTRQHEKLTLWVLMASIAGFTSFFVKQEILYEKLALCLSDY